jgi:hypothetical protein
LISSILRGWGGWWPFGSSSDSCFFLGRALSFHSSAAFSFFQERLLHLGPIVAYLCSLLLAQRYVSVAGGKRPTAQRWSVWKLVNSSRAPADDATLIDRVTL